MYFLGILYGESDFFNSPCMGESKIKTLRGFNAKTAPNRLDSHAEFGQKKTHQSRFQFLILITLKPKVTYGGKRIVFA